MLTARENMRQCIINGKPDRYVNQYEGINLLMHPFMCLGRHQCVARRHPRRLPRAHP